MKKTRLLQGLEDLAEVVEAAGKRAQVLLDLHNRIRLLSPADKAVTLATLGEYQQDLQNFVWWVDSSFSPWLDIKVPSAHKRKESSD